MIKLFYIYVVFDLLRKENRFFIHMGKNIAASKIINKNKAKLNKLQDKMTKFMMINENT
jgi:hypothetical protein